MTILFSIQNIGIGGVQTFMIRLAKALAKKHKVIIFDHYPYASEKGYIKALPEEIVYESFTKKNVSFDKLVWKINALCKIVFKQFSFWEWMKNRYYRSMVSKYNVDVVLSFDFVSDLKTVKNISGVPIVLSMHGSYDIVNGKILMPAIESKIDFIFSKISGIAYISPKNIKVLDLLKVPGKITGVEKIYYGFDPIPEFNTLEVRAKLNLPANALIFGMVARGDKTKGWLEALSAFDKVNKTYTNTKFVCIGESDYMNELREQFKTNESIIFVGFQPNPIEYIKAIDIGLLPTYFLTENLPNTVIEYLSCGKPVIATNYVEIPNMINADGEYAGTLLELNNNGKPNVVDIEVAVLSYIEHPELLKKHSELTSVAFKQFNMNVCVAKYEDLFSKVIKNY